MAKLSSYRRIVKNDYPDEYKSLIDQLSVSINNGFDTLFNALNGKLNFYDNIASTIAEFRVTVDADGYPIQKTQFKLSNGSTNIEGVLVIQVAGYNDPNLLPSSGVIVSYSSASGLVTVTNIKGLQPNKNYLVKVLVIS
jgi:hypothetical protein